MGPEPQWVARIEFSGGTGTPLLGACGDAEAKALRHRWPLPELPQWVRTLNRPLTKAEWNAVRNSVRRGTPFGTTQWQARTAKNLGLEWTMRPRGRPRKKMQGSNQRAEARFSCVPFLLPLEIENSLMQYGR